MKRYKLKGREKERERKRERAKEREEINTELNRMLLVQFQNVKKLYFFSRGEKEWNTDR